jgi:3-mercaptopyruvate sulfurtransferase SseA
MESLVTTEWLAAQLGARDLKLLDASAFLPGSGRDGRAEHEAEHIPGARFFDIEEVADPGSALPHTFPSRPCLREQGARDGDRRRGPDRPLRQFAASHGRAGMVDAAGV